MRRRGFLMRVFAAGAGLPWIGTISSRGAATAAERVSKAAAGPLHVHPANGRYFATPDGRAVYLTGSHTWNNFQDMSADARQPGFDFDAYLQFLERHRHNFIRLWRWELTRWSVGNTPEYTRQTDVLITAPHPWARTGPGTAADGAPKFDLDRFNDDYFARLRRRVSAARDRGIYVSIMLFEGWGLQHLQQAWRYHPFHPENNVQGLDGDAGGDGRGISVHTTRLPEVLRVQEAYVRKVIDTVNDLDNVLYEISNEAGTYSKDWQYHWIRFIHAYEAEKGRRHPVGMTFMYSRDARQRGRNADLFESPADWISPNPEADGGYNYRTNPPPADGSKVILSDTDHLWGIGGNPDWVWRSFLRGHHPLFMDPYDNRVLGKAPPENWEPIRRAMGAAAEAAQGLDLAAAVPSEDIASSKYCLAEPGSRYLVYVPEGESVEVDLTAAAGRWSVRWIDPLSGKIQSAEPVDGGVRARLRLPQQGPAALLLSR
ncbi:MAG: DUF6298 domain-containing protein [Thermogutta sp.]